MAAREDWCSEKSSKLLNEDLRMATLTEIKDHLTSLPKEEALQTAQNLELPIVFDCLNVSSRTQIELACEVLGLCFSNLTVGESTSRYGVALERALTHPVAGVKYMALNEIKRSITDDQVAMDLCRRISLLINILQCFRCSDLGVIQKATEILSIVGQHDFGISQLVNQDVVALFHEIMNINAIMRMRVYELFIDISEKSKSSFNVLISAGLMNPVLKELDNNDILVQLNIIELLTRLGITKHGFDFFEAHKIFEKLFEMLDNELTNSLCGPGILKFFGIMAHSKPLEVLSKYPKVYDQIFENIQKSNPTLVGTALDTLALIAINNEGKVALESTNEKITNTITLIAETLPNATQEIRLRELNCIESLLKIKEFENDISMLCERWYRLLSDDPMRMILKYADNPIKDLQVAGLSIIKSIVMHRWGQEEVKQTAGLIETLLDRRGHCNKISKEIKYAIISVLATSPVFDHLTINRLAAYVKEGPFYVEPITQVVFARQD